MGLAILLVFGVMTSRKHQEQEQEDEDYEPIMEDHRIGIPYSRLAPKEENDIGYSDTIPPPFTKAAGFLRYNREDAFLTCCLKKALIKKRLMACKMSV